MSVEINGQVVRVRLSVGQSVIDVRINNGYLQIKYSFTDWIDFIPLADITGPPGEGINYKGEVNTYSDLEDILNPVANDAYYNLGDGLLYVFNGTDFPQEGDGMNFKGNNGVGIDRIEKTGSAGLIDSYTIYYTDGGEQDFYITNGEKGDDGKNIELQKSSTHIQWRVVGSSTWTNLVALSDLKGTDGKNIELQKGTTHIQWRVVGDSTWTNLIAISDLKGDKGDSGIGFTNTTESVRIALTPSTSLPYWQTDGAIGGYYWRDSGWSFLGAKKKKTITASTYTVNPIIDVGYLLEFTNDCVVSVANGSISSGNTIDMISASGKTLTLQNSGTMTLINAIPTQSLISVIEETYISVMYTASNRGIVAGGLL